MSDTTALREGAAADEPSAPSHPQGHDQCACGSDDHRHAEDCPEVVYLFCGTDLGGTTYPWSCERPEGHTGPCGADQMAAETEADAEARARLHGIHGPLSVGAAIRQALRDQGGATA